MDTWEYYTTTLRTNHPDIAIPIQDDVPINVNHPKYSTYKLMPQLNYYGNKGWELMSLEPVQEGSNGDLRYPDTAGGQWSYTYFAVFKRRIPSAIG